MLEKKRAAHPTVLTTDGKRGKKTPGYVQEPHLDWNEIEGTRVFKWHTVKKGDTIQAGGRVNYWCKNHELTDKWDGLYTWHKPEDCKTVKKSSEEEKGGDEAKAGENLQLKDNLKTVLMSNLCLSSEDVEKMFSEAQAQEN